MYRPIDRGGGGFEGVRSNPPFCLQKILYTPPVHFKSPMFESGPLVSLLLRITTVQTSLVAAMRAVCSRITSAERMRKLLHRCDERTSVYTCINKSLFQALKSCPSSGVTPCTCCSVNLSTFSRGNSKSAGIANACVDSQKSDAILRKPCSYYGSGSVPKWSQNIKFQNISWGCMPTDPPSLACLCMY